MPPGVVLRSRAASSTPAVASLLAFRSPAFFSNSASAIARLSAETGATWRLRSPRLRSGTSTAPSCSVALDSTLLGFSQRLLRDQLPVARIQQRAEVVLAGKTELLHVVRHRLRHLARDVVVRSNDQVRASSREFTNSFLVERAQQTQVAPRAGRRRAVGVVVLPTAISAGNPT